MGVGSVYLSSTSWFDCMIIMFARIVGWLYGYIHQCIMSIASPTHSISMTTTPINIDPRAIHTPASYFTTTALLSTNWASTEFE